MLLFYLCQYYILDVNQIQRELLEELATRAPASSTHLSQAACNRLSGNDLRKFQSHLVSWKESIMLFLVTFSVFPQRSLISHIMVLSGTWIWLIPGTIKVDKTCVEVCWLEKMDRTVHGITFQIIAKSNFLITINGLISSPQKANQETSPFKHPTAHRNL